MDLVYFHILFVLYLVSLNLFYVDIEIFLRLLSVLKEKKKTFISDLGSTDFQESMKNTDYNLEINF